MLDLFRGNAFGVVELTDAINHNIPFVPGLIGQMGLFRETSVSTIDIAIEERDGILVLVPPTPRGGPGTTMPKGKRGIRVLRAPHFEINDAVMAEEVQGVRAWGTDSAVEMLQDRVTERLALAKGSLEVTLEQARVGAVIGLITYSDGSTMNLFSEFGVEQDAELNFALATLTDGKLRTFITNVARLMSKNMGGIPISGIAAICGDNFYDALLENPEYRASFLNTPAAAALRAATISLNGLSWATVEYGGITFINYKGWLAGAPVIDTDKCHLYPLGVPNLFRTYMAPADYNETVNRPGQRMYAKQWDMQNDKGVHLDTQMNPLNICTRPKALLVGRRA